MTIGHNFESVLDAAKLGADWAWTALYAEIAGPVMGFFRARGIADPQEATGDVFLELARELSDFEGDEESFKTFVFVVAYRRLLLENRYAQLRPRTALADRVLDRLDADSEKLAAPPPVDVPDEIHQAFKTLTSEQRDVVTLRIVAGLSVDQVAQVLERGATTVQNLQRRAMAQIRSLQGDPAVAL